MGCDNGSTSPPGHGDGGSGDRSTGGDASRPGDGSAGCPVYQKLCNGQCVPVVADPNNCGACGVACSGAEACSAGKCSSSCLPGLTICDHRCVDTASDSAHCGGCKTACPKGQGCAAGSCADAVPVGPAPSKCAAGGPPVSVPSGSTTICTGALAQTTFTWALCSCGSVTTANTFLTDAFDSTQGPYTPGGLGGGVGFNGALSSSNQVDVWGTLWGSSPAGLSFANQATVHQELHTGGPLDTINMTIGLDAWVAGNIEAALLLAIQKTLHVPTGATLSGPITYGSLVRQPVTVPPPCGLCAPQGLLPIAAIVAARRSANDNALIGLSPGALSQASAPLRLDLPCGEYYLDSIDSASTLTIVAHGRTAIFVGGDIRASNELAITLDPTAELDLFVGGTIDAANTLSIGSPNYPALARVYVGGQDELAFSNSATLAANLYAAAAKVSWSNSVVVYGAVYAGAFDASNSVAIHFDRQVVQAGRDCPKPTPAAGDGGVRPPVCRSCHDCGNQACVNGACASCTDSSQCCAPLMCYQGTCVLPID